jgi:hypothetical protein
MYRRKRKTRKLSQKKAARGKTKGKLKVKCKLNEKRTKYGKEGCMRSKKA